MTTKARSLKQQLDDLWAERGQVLNLETRNQKYVLISDMHMGNGGISDDFRHNEDTVVRALNHYAKKKYKLILLGDIEELWQFSLDEIVNRYEKTVYKSIKGFGDDNVYRVFGNHDIDWKITYDPVRNKPKHSFETYEAIKLKDINGVPKILLVHGHQGTVDSDKISWLSRPVVKLYGRGLEPILKVDRTPNAPRSPILDNFERERYRWAKGNNLMIICGHSHRAFFDSKTKVENLSTEIEELKKKIQFESDLVKRAKLLDDLISTKQRIMDQTQFNGEYVSLGKNPSPNYFNTGCALFKDGITVIEIAENEIKLVKWHQEVGTAPFEIQESGDLNEFVNRL